MSRARRVRQHTFNGKRYYIDIYNPHYASCDPPDSKDPEITIADGLQYNEKTLELLIHESLHACNWDKSEEKVTRTAKDISRFLWRIGYRLT